MVGSRFKIAFSLVLFGGLLLGVFADVQSRSSGVHEGNLDPGTASLMAGGCSCHNPSPSPEVAAVLEGVPPFYVPVGPGGAYEQRRYEITIRMQGGPEPREGANTGGFHLHVTGGTLLPPGDSAQASFVQVVEGGQEATHTARGDREADRVFRLQWESPAQPGPDVQFTLTVNTVNGINGNDPDDLWNRLSFLSMGAQRLGAVEAHDPIHAFTQLGVNFFAYWVGVVSFIVLLVVLAITFFVLRYGESAHWAAWKDRAAKDKAPARKEASRDWTSWTVGAMVLAFAGYAAWQLWGRDVVAAGSLEGFTFLLFVGVATLAGTMILGVYYAVTRIRPSASETEREREG